jgi:hypothetical protein
MACVFKFSFGGAPSGNYFWFAMVRRLRGKQWDKKIPSVAWFRGRRIMNK